MKRFAIASTVALAFALGGAAPAGAEPSDPCPKLGNTCETVQQILCLGNLDCPQR
jgi:hypothetical protein